MVGAPAPYLSLSVSSPHLTDREIPQHIRELLTRTAHILPHAHTHMPAVPKLTCPVGPNMMRIVIYTQCDALAHAMRMYARRAYVYAFLARSYVQCCDRDVHTIAVPEMRVETYARCKHARSRHRSIISVHLAVPLNWGQTL